MNQLLRGEPLTIFGDGTQVRAFTHINDVAPIVAGSVDVPAARNQIFNVGADVSCTVNDLAAVVADVMGLEYGVTYLPARNEVKVAFSDHSKAQTIFGQRSQTALADGVRAMAEWIRAHGARESGIFEQIEVMKNMPASWVCVQRKAIAVQ
jgi:UDP-glucose 4-epimerase